MAHTRQAHLAMLMEMRSEIAARHEEAASELEAVDVLVAMLHRQGAAAPAPAAEVEEAVRAILSKEGPMHRTKIMSRLNRRGTYVNGEKPLASLSSIMYRADDMEPYGDGTWGLTEQRNGSAPTLASSRAKGKGPFGA